MSEIVVPHACRKESGELLYGWLGRLEAQNPMGRASEAMRILLGSSGATLVVELPSRLRALATALGSSFAWADASECLMDGTLYPYHRAFLTPQRDVEVASRLLESGGNGVKTLLGIVANRFGAGTTLRCCPDCLSHDQTNGAPYWHREHHLPGVRACIIHHRRLVEVGRPGRSSHRQIAVLAPAPSVTLSSRSKACSMGEFRFAELSAELLRARLTPVDPAQRQALYMRRIEQLGLGSGGRVHFAAIGDALRHHFDDFRDFEHRDRLLATNIHPLGWLRDLVRRPERAVHPICHMLLIDFLFGSLAEYAALFPREVLADREHFKQQTVKGREHHPRASEAIPHLLDPVISCSEVARRAGLSVSTVVSLRRSRGVAIKERRKTLTSEKSEEIRRDLLAGRKPQAIAERREVSMSSVYRIRASMGKQMVEAADKAKKKEVDRNRERWSKLLASQMHVGRARARWPALYAWLYRHDRLWLQLTCRSLPRAMSERPSRVDWDRRDTDLVRKAERYVEELKASCLPSRISQSLLLRPLGEAMVRKNLCRLPGLRAALDRLVESPADFEKRRVQRAREKLAAEGLPLDPWRIARLAHLRRPIQEASE